MKYAWAWVLLVGGTAHAQTIVTVTGGVEDFFEPVAALQFKQVYPGQVFPSVGVPSAAAAVGFLNNDCTFGVLPNCSWSPLGAGSPVDFAMSVIPLTKSQVTAYDQANAAREGPPIQFPAYGVALAIPVVNAGVTGNGKLVLGDGQLCGIFSGVLTDWSQFDPFAVPGGFQIVYDTNPGSGATWLLTQHLNAVCDSTNSAFTTLPVPVTGDFSTLPVPGGVASNPRFVGAVGNAGMRAALLGSTSAIGYITPNYTSVYSKSPVTSTLKVAGLFNQVNRTTYTPSAANTLLALAHPGAGAVNAAPPANATSAADPTAWVPQLPMPAQGYPIVGYVNWIFSTCYLNDANAILDFLTMPYHPGTIAGDASAEGFVPLSQANLNYSTAVANVLTSDAAGYNLNIQNPAVCGGRVVKPIQTE